MARPREYDDGVRDDLLHIAGRVLAEEGPAALTVRRLAAEVDGSTSVVYSLFGSKVGVIRAMHRAGFRALANHLAAVATDQPPVERIRQLAMAYRTAAVDNPHLYDVMFACPVPEFVPTEQDQVLARSTLQRLRDAVTDAVAQQHVAGDPEELTMGLWAVVHGLASLELAGALIEVGGVGGPERVWTTTVEATLVGLAATPSRPAVG